MSQKIPRRNIYICQGCAEPVVTVDVDEGVTPFMIPCMLCGATMHSLFYPKKHYLYNMHRVRFEWSKPTKEDIQKCVDNWPEAEHDIREAYEKNGQLMMQVRTAREPLYHEVTSESQG